MFSFVPSKMVARCMMRLEIIDQKKKKRKETRDCAYEYCCCRIPRGKKSNQAVAACLEKEDVRICGWWH